MNWLKQLFFGDPIFGGVQRSPQWSRVRGDYIALHPKCAVCGTKKDCEVHHIHPYHLEPSLELNPRNFITLCRDHHFLFGHLMDWQSYDIDVESSAHVMRDRITNRP